MNTLFEMTFLNDLEKTKDKFILDQVREVITQAKSVETAEAIKGLSSMKDYKSCYRINVGNYRLGLQTLNEKLVFVRLIHCTDLYRYFP